MRTAHLWLIAFLLSALPAVQAQDTTAPRVRVETNHGSFVIELDAARAPLTVASFLGYVRAGHYAGRSSIG